MYQLSLIKGPKGVGQHFPLLDEQPNVLGRAEDAHIKLSDGGVSKKHCQITILAKNKIQIEDLGSSNGTFVNGILVRNHFLKAGDLITINNYTFKLSPSAPSEVMLAPEAPIHIKAAPFSPNKLVENFKSGNYQNTAGDWLEKNLYPWADRLAFTFDLRILILSLLVVWSLAIALLTASPFMQEANKRIHRQSIEVAILYARQLARVNQNFFIEENAHSYRDLISKLDEAGKETKGIINSMILDAEKNQILAPASLMGNPLPSAYAAQAIKDTLGENKSGKSREGWLKDSEDNVHVWAPIVVGTSQGNKGVATAYVIFNPEVNQFSFVNMLDQVTSSTLLGLIVAIVLVLFMYRWIDTSVLRVGQGLDQKLTSGEGLVESQIKWPALQELIKQANFVLTRAQNALPVSQGSSYTKNSSTFNVPWASQSAQQCEGPAGALNEQMQILHWNEALAKLLNMSGHMVGLEFSQACRDLSFESQIKELCQRAQQLPWMPVENQYEHNNRALRLIVTYGAGEFLITLKSSSGGHS